MGSFHEYLLQVTASAVICGVLSALYGKMGTVSKLIRLLCMVFMTVVILSPVTKIRLDDVIDEFQGIDTEAGAVVNEAKEQAREQISADIERRLEAYIQEKAASLGTQLEIDVQTTEEGIPTPCGVRLLGAVSPYAKGRLSAWIREELGIGLEAQEWIS